MNAEERFNLITRNTIEVITPEELRRKLETGDRLKAYIGYEPSGLMHIGWLIWVFKVADMIRAGVDFTILEATWHAYINDKLGGSMELIRTSARLIRKTLQALGIPVEKIRFIDAEDLAGDKDYWALVIRVSKSNSVKRIRRALTIMGRRMDEADLDASKLIYPAMQVADIFYLDLDIALGGMDQRKAHMLARDTAEKLKRKKPIAVHTPLLTSLRGLGRMDSSKIAEMEIDELYAEIKASKSDLSSTIFLHEDPDSIRSKIRRAYCPPREVKFNPIIEINKYILFARPGFKLVVERPAKYGGTVVYEKYEELERDYVEGRLHPVDLKNATANALIEMLEPARRALLSDSETRGLIERIMGNVTR